MTRTTKTYPMGGALAAVLVAVGVAVLVHAGLLLPSWVDWNAAQVEADLDGDGAEEVLGLSGRRMQVVETDGSVSQAPQEWKVSDAFAVDVDGDGLLEVVALVWKRGSFGPSRPFWIEKDNQGYSQHVFVLRYADGGFDQVWLSSDIRMDARKAWFDDDARLHLVTLDGQESIWTWGEWGFVLVE
ncbi:FG-GAP repeat domain-containing protein [Slackia heliotrinireducens]|nr:VCBS repeat-containing protein [Slackia heliotrinireducens]